MWSLFFVYAPTRAALLNRTQLLRNRMAQQRRMTIIGGVCEFKNGKNYRHKTHPIIKDTFIANLKETAQFYFLLNFLARTHPKESDHLLLLVYAVGVSPLPVSRWRFTFNDATIFATNEMAILIKVIGPFLRPF